MLPFGNIQLGTTADQKSIPHWIRCCHLATFGNMDFLASGANMLNDKPFSILILENSHNFMQENNISCKVLSSVELFEAPEKMGLMVSCCRFLKWPKKYQLTVFWRARIVFITENTHVFVLNHKWTTLSQSY